MSQKSIWVTYSPSVIDPNGELFACVQYLDGMKTLRTVKVWAEPLVAEDLVDNAIRSLQENLGDADFVVRTEEERKARAECMVRQQ